MKLESPIMIFDPQTCIFQPKRIAIYSDHIPTASKEKETTVPLKFGFKVILMPLN
jgi:hypothetical protein